MKRAGIFLLLILVSVVSSGCFVSRELSSLQRDLERQHPDLRLRRNIVFSAGPGLLHTLEQTAGKLDRDDARLIEEYLHDVDRVKVGIYDVEWRNQSEPVTTALPDRFKRGGWEPAVTVRDGHESVFLMYRSGSRSLRDLFVVSLADDQLVMVRIRGNVERLVSHALADRHRFLQTVRHATGEEELAEQ